MIKTFFITGFLFILGYSVFALWQRQPKNVTLPQNSSTQSASTKPQNFKNPLVLTPEDGTVLSSNEVEISGTITPNVKVLIYSNTSQNVAAANTNGSFSQKINLAEGLNLLTVMPLDPSLQKTNAQGLTLYYSKNNVGKKVVAGLVKSTFDTAITITTPNGDISIKTSKDTTFDIPKDEKELEATSEVDNIRIGDYLIVTEEGQTAKTLKVLRQNKPQITEQVQIGTIGTIPKQNIFSVKSSEDGKLVELKLTKNTKVSENGIDAKTSDIIKDKMAIIFFFVKDPDNIADLVYLLP